MTQKLLKVGGSTAVTIPKKSLDALGLKAGDKVAVEIEKGTRTLTVRPVIEISGSVVAWTEKFIAKYRSALEELAKK